MNCKRLTRRRPKKMMTKRFRWMLKWRWTRLMILWYSKYDKAARWSELNVLEDEKWRSKLSAEGRTKDCTRRANSGK
jgi:hypothetical protein